jgi:hypothetical protein
LLLNPNQTPLLNALGFSAAVTQTQHQWFEDEMFSYKTTVVGAVTNVATTVVVADGSLFRVGHVIKVGDELMLVTAVAGASLTVTRAYAGTTAAAIADAAPIDVMFVEGSEGADARTARYKARVQKSNNTQIFDDTIEVSGTATAVTQYGITDLYETEKQKKQLELALQLEKALIGGVGYVNGQIRQMKGIRNFIVSNVTNASSTALDGTKIGDAAQAIYQAGGFATGGDYVIMVGAKQKRALSAIDANKILISRSENTRGQVVDKFATDFGEFEINLNNNLAPDELLLVDRNRTFIRPLVGRDFFHKYMGDVGDTTRGILVGEYTLEMQQEKAHARIKGLA